MNAAAKLNVRIEFAILEIHEMFVDKISVKTKMKNCLSCNQAIGSKNNHPVIETFSSSETAGSMSRSVEVERVLELNSSQETGLNKVTGKRARAQDQLDAIPGPIKKRPCNGESRLSAVPRLSRKNDVHSGGESLQGIPVSKKDFQDFKNYWQLFLFSSMQLVNQFSVEVERVKESESNRMNDILSRLVDASISCAQSVEMSKGSRHASLTRLQEMKSELLAELRKIDDEFPELLCGLTNQQDIKETCPSWNVIVDYKAETKKCIKSLVNELDQEIAEFLKAK